MLVLQHPTASHNHSPSAQSNPPLLTLDDPAATDADSCGHKAATLALLRQAGFDVPPGFVVPATQTESLDEAAIAGALQLLVGPVAVRSSGLAEDLAEASFAGQYDTILNVEGPEDVCEAIVRCAHSAASARVQAYGGGDRLAVLVQSMVRADVAGVAFSANPLTGDRDEVVINATQGLADRLLEGEVDGDAWSVRGGTATATSNHQGCLDESTAVRISELARKLEAHFGVPQDVEWALFEGRLVLLQARPIGVLPIAPHIETPEGTWQKDTMHFAEPITPFGASTHLHQDAAFDTLVEEWGLLPDSVRARVIGHEYYLHIGPDDGGAKPPPWWVLGLLARLVPSFRRKLRQSKEAIDRGLLESLPKQWEEELKPALLSRLADLRSVDLGALDDAALCEHLDLLQEFSRQCMTLHFRLFVPNLVGVYELAKTCKQLLGWESHQAAQLVQGLSTTSSASVRDLADIAAHARGRPAARTLIEEARPNFVQELQTVDPEVGERVAAYLQTWGTRTFGGDAGTPNLEEKPELLALLLVEFMNGQAKESPLAIRERAIQKAQDALKTDEDRKRFERALRYAETVYPLREDNVLLTDQMSTGLLRRVGLEFGKRLAGRGLVSSKQDAALLTAEELREALLGTSDGALRDVVGRRKGEMLWVRANPGPAHYGAAPGPLPDLRGFPEASRRLNEAILWEAEQEFAPPAQCEGDALGGLAASSGTHRGKVRVVRSLHDLHTVHPGEVLVCPTTSAAWTMVFARAGALVTEAGSSLCHTAIVAREYSLPAVVSVKSATTLLKTGDEVIVDGSRGVVTRCG